MKLPSPGFLLQSFAQSIRRFPATMLCATLAVTLLYIMIADNNGDDALARVLMVSLLGIPLQTGLVAWSESKGWDEKRSWLLQLLGLVALAGYAFFLDPNEPGFEYRGMPGYVSLLLVAHLFVAVAPYLNDRSVRDFWEYNKELFATIVIGASFTFILFAGLGLAILAVDQLFDINFSEKVYLRLLVFLAGIFNTAYFLAHFPKNYAFETSENTYTALFKNLCKFIFIPIVGLYFLILYAYSFKIIGTWALPRGWVGSLVTGFSVAGIFTYLLNFYLPEQDSSRQVHAYRRWFWWVLAPLTVLLCLAIGRRIGDYGVTEVRFLVAQMGVWLAITCLYFLLSKKDNIKFIPISLAVFALTWAFGPFSASAVSERSQMSRIRQVLEQTGRLEAGKLKPGKAPVTEMESTQLEASLDFLERRNRLEILNPMLPMPIDSLPEAPGFYGNSGKLTAWLGMGSASVAALASKQLNVYSNSESVDVRGYATFKPISLSRSSEISFQEKDDYFKISEDGKMLEWWTFDGNTTKTMVEQFDLQPIMKKWHDLKNIDLKHEQLSPSERLTDFIGKTKTLRLVVEHGSAEKGDSGFSMQSLNGFVFLK